MSDWDRDVALLAKKEAWSASQTSAVQTFVDAMMRLDSVEVSVDSVTWSDRTTQAFTATDETEEGPLPTDIEPSRRYLDLGRIGMGGMGEVRRVRDTVLNRFVAMKILRPKYGQSPAAVRRFIAESQATAQLQHPGMVPVHDVGQLPDGRWYFTMRQVSGDSLADVMRAHRAGDTNRGLRGLVELLARVCDAVAYAHANGAVHRDLKPANVIVGAFGEVIVLDWGLVKATGSPDGTTSVVTDLNAIGTKLGSIIGTPAYMPPEQARGAHDEVRPATDVYALGAVLYEILAGRRPYLGVARDVIEQLLDGPPEPLPHTVPLGLVQVVHRAMARQAADRHANAGELGADLRAWLDGAARRERALGLLEAADRLQPDVESALRRADDLAEEAEALLTPLPSWSNSDQKTAGWALQDASERERIQADLIGIERLQLLRSALAEMPEMPEAHDRLAYVYHFCHARAERLGDQREAAQYEALLRAHDRGTYADYLDGEGTLTLLSRPAAHATLYRFEPVDRRMLPVRVQDLGPTPIDRHALSHGSYVVEVRRDGHRPCRFPVMIERNSDWHGIPPAGRAPMPLPLPAMSQVDRDERYVPAGWCKVGERPLRDVWVDGFYMQRFPVTHRTYLSFLNELVRAGNQDQATTHQPMTDSGPCYTQTEDGTFVADPDVWVLDAPVVYIDLRSARTYAQWLASRTGLPWRLPWEVEWEKAARGVDGRTYVMGDFLDPTWAEVRGSQEQAEICDVTAFPTDSSVYGVRGLTGGVADWCEDQHRARKMEIRGSRVPEVPARDDERAVCRGGFRSAPTAMCVASFRHAVPADRRTVRVGFRLVRSVVPELDPDTSGVWRLQPT